MKNEYLTIAERSCANMVVWEHRVKAGGNYYCKITYSLHFFSISQGFDEYMNIVLDDAAEINVKTKESTPVGMLIV